MGLIDDYDNDGTLTGTDKVLGTNASDGTTKNYLLSSLLAYIETDFDPAAIKTLYESNADTNAFTDAEQTKLAGLSTIISGFVGTYTTSGALAAAHPSPTEGSFGHVDAGASSNVELWVWDNSDSVWREVVSGSGGATQLSELSDVADSTATDKNVLVADGTDWHSRALTLVDLSDVADSTATNRNVIVADGTDWHSRPLVIADVSDYSDTSLSAANQSIGTDRTVNVTTGNSLEMQYNGTAVARVDSADRLLVKGIGAVSGTTYVDINGAARVGQLNEAGVGNSASDRSGQLIRGTQNVGLLWSDGTDWRHLAEQEVQDGGAVVGMRRYLNFTGNAINSITDDSGNDRITIDITQGAGGVSQLSDLSDVAVSTPTDKFALMADGTDFHSRALVIADISDYTSPALANTDQTISVAERIVDLAGANSVMTWQNGSGGDVAQVSKTRFLANQIEKLGTNTDPITFSSPIVLHTGGVASSVTVTNPVEATMVWDGPTKELRLYHDGAFYYVGKPNVIQSDITGLTGATKVTNHVIITQAGFDAIPTPDGNTIYDISDAEDVVWLQYAITDETTALTVGNNKLEVIVPFACTLKQVEASAKTAPTGADINIQLQRNGTDVLTTKVAIPAGTKTSETATDAVIDGAQDEFAAFDILTFDVDQIGATVAGAGVKLYLRVDRT